MYEAYDLFSILFYFSSFCDLSDICYCDCFLKIVAQTFKLKNRRKEVEI